jgi:hypothetical protein
MSDTTQTTEQVQSTDSVPAQLQLADILLAAQAISLASQRGAFKAEEFTQIGGCFDRITAFLRDSGALNTAPASEQTADQSSAE